MGPSRMTDIFVYHPLDEISQRCSFLPDLVLENGCMAKDIEVGMKLLGGKVLKIISPEDKEKLSPESF